jgi:two-component system, cell cycle response regulator
MRRHTLIGERIIAAAPALGRAAKLVRSSHQASDGTGAASYSMPTRAPAARRVSARSEPGARPAAGDLVT